MKDGLLLLATSIVCAIAAWLFWNATGQWGFLILAVITYGSLIADNARLRNRIRNLTKGR